MKKLIRTGTCNRCGECCIGCAHFEEPNICRIYPDRGLGCRTFPSHPFYAEHPSCSFLFFDAETEDLLPRGNLPWLLETYEPLTEEC